MKLSRKDFLDSINYKQMGARTLANNTSIDREFHTAVINGEVWSGFYSEEDINKLRSKENL